LAIFGLFCTRLRTKIDTFVFLGTLLTLHLLLRVAAYFLDTYDWSRSFAAFYNIVVLCSALIFFSLTAASIKKSGAEAVSAIRKSAQRVFFGSAFLATATWCLALLPAFANEISLPTPIGLLVQSPMNGILETSRSLVFTRADWGAGISLPRSVVMAGFPTSAAMVIVSLGFLSLLENPSGPARTIINCLMVVCVALTLTRTVLIGLAFGAILSIFLRRKNKVHWLAMTALVLLSLGMALWGWLGQGTNTSAATSYRAASAEARIDGYRRALDAAQQDPIFGIGVKPRDDDLFIPVGSHSTPVGMYLKGGVIGAGLVVLMFGALIRRAVASLAQRPIEPQRLAAGILYLRYLLVACIWLAFEDIDAYVYVSGLVFITLAALQPRRARAHRAIPHSQHPSTD
jgi:hypothetical protein